MGVRVAMKIRREPAARLLLSGGQALARAALSAGCGAFFSHPLTPGRGLTEAMSQGLAATGGVHLAADSPEEALAMLAGAAACGTSALTACSGPGLSRMQEGISHLCALELPAVIAVFSRGGPGLGNFAPAQGDYLLATRGGHGDGRCLVLAPWSVRELCDCTVRAFDLAFKFRNPVILLADALLGSLMEPVSPPPPRASTYPAGADWILDGARGRPGRSLVSFLPDPKELQARNHKLVRKYDAMRREEAEWQAEQCEDARLVVATFGGAARIAREAVTRVRDMGLAVGLFRPRTLWPFPERPLQELARQARHFLALEMNTGQMVDDLRLGLEGRARVWFHGWPGGRVPTPADLAHQISHHYHLAGLHRGAPE